MKYGKRLLSVLLALSMLASLAGVASAMGFANGTCGLHATWELSFTGVLTIDGTGDIKAYAPKATTDFRKYSSRIKSVVIGSSITGIGSCAFQGLPVLASAKLGEAVIKIDKYAFADCPSLASVTIQPSVFTIGEYAFSNCTSLKSIVIPETVTKLGAYAFAGCTSLQTVEVQSKNCVFAANNILPQGVTVAGYQGSTAQAYAAKNGLTFKALDAASPEQPTQPATQPTQPATDPASTDQGDKCPLCGQTHEGFPGSLIGGIHSFIYGLLMLFGMRK